MKRAAVFGLIFLWAGAGCLSVGGADFVFPPCSKPWGAMYAPVEIGALRYGMSGIVTYARHSNMAGFLQELDEARRNQVRLLVTLGSVSVAPFYHQPSRTFDAAGYYAQEVAPFFREPAGREALRNSLQEGILWGFRFLDEPHDRQNDIQNTVTTDRRAYPHAMEPAQFAELLNLFEQDLRGLMAAGGSPSPEEDLPLLRLGTTSPPDYMNLVRPFCRHPHLFAYVGYRWPSAQPPEEMFRDWGDYASENNLSLVGSLNSSSSVVDDAVFFETMIWLCGYPRVHFATSWDWGRVQSPGAKSFQQRMDGLFSGNRWLWMLLMLRCRLCL